MVYGIIRIESQVSKTQIYHYEMWYETYIHVFVSDFPLYQIACKYDFTHLLPLSHVSTPMVLRHDLDVMANSR